jgi:very-short-patch-repair endonuclease
MPTSIDPATILRARRLRRGMTQGERKLWAELREFRRWYGVHVRRQAPIGAYIADFIVHEKRVVIEVDGQHHFEPNGVLRDRARDQWLAGQGYRVLRFNTGEIADAFEGCIEEILRELGLMGAEKSSAASQEAR